MGGRELGPLEKVRAVHPFPILPAMKPRYLRSTLLLTTALAVLGAAGFALRAEDKDKTKSAERPPLTLKSDAKAINRDATDRVSYSSIVKKTAPSVVYVFSSKKVKVPENMAPFFNDPQFRRFFGVPDQDQRGGRNNPGPVQQGLGSGVIISSDGYILTNNHVIEGADKVKVAFGEPRREFKATIVGRDPKADVAVVKINATGLAAATLGDSDQLEVGDVVLAIGNPFGIGQSVSRGIVSALSRGGLGIEQYEDFIQTDAAINPGNSGGALLDIEGRLIGINTAILSRSGGFNGVGFAIPINQARSIAEQLVKHGRVDRAYLGVQTQPARGGTLGDVQRHAGCARRRSAARHARREGRAEERRHHHQGRRHRDPRYAAPPDDRDAAHARHRGEDRVSPARASPRRPK